MKMNDDPEWITKMAALEDNCDVSVGNPDILYEIIVAKIVAERQARLDRAAELSIWLKKYSQV